MIQILWSRRSHDVRVAFAWGLAGAVLLFSLAGCSLFSASAVGDALDKPVVQLAGNWWSDGTFRVIRRDPDSVAQLWQNQDGPYALLPFTRLTGILPETAAALDEKCRELAGNGLAFWLGWRLRSPNPFPAGPVCFSGEPHSDAEVAEQCAAIRSRGRRLVMAWNRADEFVFACKEPWAARSGA